MCVTVRSRFPTKMCDHYSLMTTAESGLSMYSKACGLKLPKWREMCWNTPLFLGNSSLTSRTSEAYFKMHLMIDDFFSWVLVKIQEVGKVFFPTFLDIRDAKEERQLPSLRCGFYVVYSHMKPKFSLWLGNLVFLLWLVSQSLLLVELMPYNFPWKNQLIWGSILCLAINFAKIINKLNAFETDTILNFLLKPVKGLGNYEEREDNPLSTHMDIMTSFESKGNLLVEVN